MKGKIVYFLTALNLITFSFYLFSFSNKGTKSPSDTILKVGGIVIVDSLGIERVVIGAHLPNPNFSNGYRVAARGKLGSVSGVMLFDHEGQERGGYVTDDDYGNAFLTLDSKTQQHLLLISEPQGGASLHMWDRGNNKVKIGVNNQSANLEILSNNQKVTICNDEK